MLAKILSQRADVAQWRSFIGRSAVVFILRLLQTLSEGAMVVDRETASLRVPETSALDIRDPLKI